MPRETVDIDFLKEVWNVEEEVGLWAFFWFLDETMKVSSFCIPIPHIWHDEECFWIHSASELRNRMKAKEGVNFWIDALGKLLKVIVTFTWGCVIATAYSQLLDRVLGSLALFHLCWLHTLCVLGPLPTWFYFVQTVTFLNVPPQPPLHLLFYLQTFEGIFLISLPKGIFWIIQRSLYYFTLNNPCL